MNFPLLNIFCKFLLLKLQNPIHVILLVNITGKCLIPEFYKNIQVLLKGGFLSSSDKQKVTTKKLIAKPYLQNISKIYQYNFHFFIFFEVGGSGLWLCQDVANTSKIGFFGTTFASKLENPIKFVPKNCYLAYLGNIQQERKGYTGPGFPSDTIWVGGACINSTYLWILIHFLLYCVHQDTESTYEKW